MPRGGAVAGVVAAGDHGRGRGGRLVIDAGETRGVRDAVSLDHATPLHGVGDRHGQRLHPLADGLYGELGLLALVLLASQIEQQVRHRFDHLVVVKVDRQLDDRASFGSRARSRAAIRCRSRSRPSLRAVA